MRAFRKIVTVFLLLCLLGGCAGTVTVQRLRDDEPKTITFTERNATPFDPSAHRYTVWFGSTEALAQWLTISEDGDTRVMIGSNDYWLRPDGDRFLMEIRLYRTPFDENPALTIPVGEAELLLDGEVCRFRPVSDPLNLLPVSAEEIYYTESQTLSAAQKSLYFMDFLQDDYLPHLQPNTEWTSYGFPSELLLRSDANGAVSGSVRIDDTPIACELLIGHHGFDSVCALVKAGAKGMDDVLLLGQVGNTSEREFTSMFEMRKQADPLTLLSGNKMRLYKSTSEDAAEYNWVGMNVYELLYRLESDGFESEEIRLLDADYPCAYRLQKDDQTILLFVCRMTRNLDREWWYVSAYAHYAGKTLLSWGGMKPIDHTIADTYDPENGLSFDMLAAHTGSRPFGYYSFWLLDDCRIFGIDRASYDITQESRHVIYDALTGEIG